MKLIFKLLIVVIKKIRNGTLKDTLRNLTGGDISKNISIYSYLLSDKEIKSLTVKKSEPFSIIWVLPHFSLNGGGFLNIFRMIYNLEKFGYKSQIVIHGSTRYKSEKEALDVIQINYLCNPEVKMESKVVFGLENASPAEFAIATEWRTAYPLQNYSGVKYKCYFVQDFEPYFFPMGSSYILAENTYKMGFYGITAGKWLAKKLSSEYKMVCSDFGFSYDQHLYFPANERKGESKKRVFYYARPRTERRGMEIGVLALQKVYESFPDVEIVMAGADLAGYTIPFPFVSMGPVDIDNLNDLYNSCDVALVISFTNVSLLPLEIMASGCAVVSNSGPNVEWLLNKSNCVLADNTISDIAAKVIDLLKDDEKRKKVRDSGLKYAQKTDWIKEAEKVHNFLSKIRKKKSKNS